MASEKGLWLVSACLTGEACRMDGRDNLVEEVRLLLEQGRAVPVCPECLGGLPTPRSPSELQPDGRVVNRAGEDVTGAFQLGAERALEICRTRGCAAAVLKARSPSCGRGVVYDGSFTSTRVPGDGVFARLLREQGIPVLTEEEYAAWSGKGYAMEQIARIIRYEQLLDRITAAEAALNRALDAFAELQADRRELEAYYTGPDWREDFEADEAGRLPAELKRGVLSEDAVYDALSEYRALLQRMQELAGSDAQP